MAIGTREEITKVRMHLHNVFGVQDFGPIEPYLGMKIKRGKDRR